MKDIKTLAELAGKTVKDNGPTLLTATACGGVLATTVLAVKATPRALEVMHENDREDYGIKDAVKDTWKIYIPTAIVGVGTVSCIVGANYLSMKESAVLASAYTLSERAYSEYRDRAEKIMGKDKTEKVREEIIKERMSNTKLPAVEIREGDQLCYDVFSGRYFASNKQELDKCLNMLNQALVNDTWVSLNTWYSLVGLHNIKIGDEFGWNTDNLVRIIYGTTMADDDRPCLTIDFQVDPRLDVYRAHSM